MEIRIDDYMKREQYRYTTEIFKKKAIETHGDRYDYSKTVYVNKRTKVLITCSIHGEFKQDPMRHIQGQGCPDCGKLVAKQRNMDCKNKRKTTDEFKNDVKGLYGDKYEVIGEYINNKTKIEIYCHKTNKDGKEHGKFLIKPNDLLCGHGCHKCVHSSMEDDINTLLNNYNINFESQKKFDWLGKQSLDFYLPDYNVAIECQGKQHFKPVNFRGEDKDIVNEKFEIIKKNDKRKHDLCVEHNIRLLYYTNKDNYNEKIYDYKLITDPIELFNEITKIIN